MRFFFYGSLLDPEVRARVLGPLACRVVLDAAILEGWEKFFRPGVPWPMIRRRTGAVVEGAVASGLDREGARRLDAYEGDLYRRQRISVDAGAGRVVAFVYVPKSTGR